MPLCDLAVDTHRPPVIASQGLAAPFARSHAMCWRSGSPQHIIDLIGLNWIRIIISTCVSQRPGSTLRSSYCSRPALLMAALPGNVAAARNWVRCIRGRGAMCQRVRDNGPHREGSFTLWDQICMGLQLFYNYQVHFRWRAPNCAAVSFCNCCNFGMIGVIRS